MWAQPLPLLSAEDVQNLFCLPAAGSTLTDREWWLAFEVRGFECRRQLLGEADKRSFRWFYGPWYTAKYAMEGAAAFTTIS